MTHIALLGAVLALFAFIHFLHRFSNVGSMRDWRRTQGRLVTAFYHPRNPAEALIQPLSLQGAARAALICALLLVMLAAIFWLA